MSRLLGRLRNAVLQGAALAAATGGSGCYDSEDDPTLDASTGPSGRGGEGGSSTPMAGAGRASPMTMPRTDGSVPLAAYPLERLGCHGDDHDGGYFGRCCVKAVCDVPQPSGFCASSPDHGLPAGSGTCGCSPFEGFERDGIEGPYAPNPADPADPSADDGQCCYLVATITCTGRPLIVGGAFVVARLVLRSDWAGLA